MKDTMQNKEKKYFRKKYIIPVVILLCILAGYIYMVVTWSPIDSESAKASEAIIREVAARSLGKDSNDLNDEDFSQITRISISEKELSDIKLLEKFTNLQRLYLNYIKFPKKNIPQWMTLISKIGLFDLSHKVGIDINALRKIYSLEEINVSGAQISNIEPLSELTNLKTLYLCSCKVSDLEPLKNLKNLQCLSFNSTRVSNLEPLKGLSDLRELSINETDVLDIEPLKGLINLQILDIGNTKVSDIEPLKKLENLVSLYIYDTQVLDIEPLKELKNLKITNNEKANEYIRPTYREGWELKDIT